MVFFNVLKWKRNCKKINLSYKKNENSFSGIGNICYYGTPSHENGESQKYPISFLFSLISIEDEMSFKHFAKIHGNFFSKI